MSEKQPVLESELLGVKIEATLGFHFGSICDRIDETLVLTPKLAAEILEVYATYDKWSDFDYHLTRIITSFLENAANRLKREARNHGNESSRVIKNHLKYVRIQRRHSADKINVERIARIHEKGNQHGDSTI